MARHLVTGAAGFIGRHLVRALEQAGEAVTPLGRAQAGDLFRLDEAGLARLIAGHDVVHHLAWSTIPQTSEADPAADLGDNIPLFVRVLRAARSEDARVVFASSGGTVYGRGTGASFREDDPLRPVGAHGAGKAAAELYARAALAAGADVRIARLANPYGAGQATSRMQGAASRFAAQALAGERIEIWGDGSVVRDYVHVADAVDGLVRLAAADRNALGPDPVVNLGSGVGTSLAELVVRIGEAVGRTAQVAHRRARAFDVPANVLDVARAAERLGWRPRLTLACGLARMTADLRADPAAPSSTLHGG